MSTVAITQRVAVDPNTQERRDALDQRWHPFLQQAGLTPVIIPNHLDTALAVLSQAQPHGLILSGGNSLVAYHGDAPERDQVETALLDHALTTALPTIGVCRGMQMIQHRFDVPLLPIEGHITKAQQIQFRGQPRTVNSYHHFGSTETHRDLIVDATAADGTVKAIRHTELPLIGMMWHPERQRPFDRLDIDFFHHFFRA